MTIERKDCPRCGQAMAYIFPAARPNPAVDRLLDRFQECRNPYCARYLRQSSLQLDVVAGLAHQIQRDGDHLVIDGKPYKKLEAWLADLGLLGDGAPRS